MEAAGTHRLVSDGPPKNESAHEETRVDHCCAFGDAASRSASRYRHNNGHLNRHLNRHNGDLNRHNNRRYLRRGNGRDILQRTRRREHEWLRIEQRDRVERRVRIERWDCQQHIVHSGLPGVSAGERTVQLNQLCDGRSNDPSSPWQPSQLASGQTIPREVVETNAPKLDMFTFCNAALITILLIFILSALGMIAVESVRLWKIRSIRTPCWNIARSTAFAVGLTSQLAGPYRPRLVRSLRDQGYW